MKLKKVKTIFNTCPVRNFCTREWSPIRCNKSPMSFVSKNDIGSFSNLMKKSLTNEMFIRMEMWSNSQRRIKSVAVRPITIISSPNSTSHIKPISPFLIPTSTIAWVRKGKINCRMQPNSRPSIIWTKYFLYCFMYSNRYLKDLFLGTCSVICLWKLSVGISSITIPHGSPSCSELIQWSSNSFLE